MRAEDVSAPLPRLRWGIGGRVATAQAWTSDGHWAVVVPALEASFGVQLRRDLGLFLEAEAGTLQVMTQLSGALVLEYLPHPSWALGVGGGAAVLQNTSLASCGDRGACEPWVGATLPLHVALLFGKRHEWSTYDRRTTFRLQLTLTPGVDVRTADAALLAGLSAAVHWM